jgi:hypothetical protein
MKYKTQLLEFFKKNAKKKFTTNLNNDAGRYSLGLDGSLDEKVCTPFIQDSRGRFEFFLVNQVDSICV